MDAGEWAEAEPGQDGSSEAGGPRGWWPGRLSFGGVALAPTSGVDSLGILLDPTLTMETQVALVVCTAFFHLWWIARLRPYLDTGALTVMNLIMKIE